MCLNWCFTLITLSLLIFEIRTSCPSGWSPSLADGTKCYFVALTKMQWFDAENYCQNMIVPDAHLTSILSAFETNDISAIVANNPAIGALDQVWIGASGHDGIFTWSDKSPFVYTNWLAGQPDLSQPCVSMLVKSSGRWRTDHCFTEYFFICKYIMQKTSQPTDCYDCYFNNGNSTSGIYTIWPLTAPFDVFCEMDADEGGWTVIQRRLDGNLSFWDKKWNEYTAGFNNGLKNNFWLGNANIHILTNIYADTELRIDIWGDRGPNSPNPNGYWFEKYSGFYTGDEVHKWSLHLDDTSTGNASTPESSVFGFGASVGHPFSAFDVDHSYFGHANCSGGPSFEYGGWWYGGTCGSVALNGKYVPRVWHDTYGLVWLASDYHMINPIQTRMMLRSKHVPITDSTPNTNS